MVRLMSITGHGDEVFQSVIVAHPIDVVDYFIRGQIPSVLPFPEQAMFHHKAISGGFRVTRDIYRNVACVESPTASEVWGIRSRLGDPSQMSLDTLHRVSPKDALLAPSECRQSCRLTTPALTKSRRKLFWSWLVAVRRWLSPMTVTSQVARLIVALGAAIRKWAATSATAQSLDRLHRLLRPMAPAVSTSSLVLLATTALAQLHTPNLHVSRQVVKFRREVI